MPEIERMPIPPLDIRLPDCPLCGLEVSWEDGYVCEDCEVVWPEQHGEFGCASEFRLPEEVWPQCPEEISPFADADDRYASIRGYRFRCVRQENHVAGGGVVDRQHFGVRVDRGSPEPHNTHSWYAPLRASRVPSG